MARKKSAETAKRMIVTGDAYGTCFFESEDEAAAHLTEAGPGTKAWLIIGDFEEMPFEVREIKTAVFLKDREKLAKVDRLAAIREVNKYGRTKDGKPKKKPGRKPKALQPDDPADSSDSAA